MTGDIVARRYAHALFAIGREQGLNELESYGRTFEKLTDLLDQSQDLDRLLRAPVISAGEKNAVLDKVLKGLDASPIMFSFCHLLAEKTRLPLLRAVADAYRAQLDEAKGVVRGTVVTAVPLDSQREQELAATLGKKAGAQLVLGFEVDPDILGGLVLHLGNTVMDASLRAQLCALIDTIKRGE